MSLLHSSLERKYPQLHYFQLCMTQKTRSYGDLKKNFFNERCNCLKVKSYQLIVHCYGFYAILCCCGKRIDVIIKKIFSIQTKLAHPLCFFTSSRPSLAETVWLCSSALTSTRSCISTHCLPECLFCVIIRTTAS